MTQQTNNQNNKPYRGPFWANDAYQVSVIAENIISLWAIGQPVDRLEIMTAAKSLRARTDNVFGIDPEKVLPLWDKAYNAAKFIAMQTGLKIPKDSGKNITKH